MKNSFVAKALLASSLTFSFSTAFAFFYDNTFTSAGTVMSAYTLDCPHWYVTGNIGVSHLFDKKAPGSTDSVSENGPGWMAGLGYQFNSLLGAELAYTQYHDSRENNTLAGVGVNIAKTEHYAVSLAATGRYPLAYQLSVLGKLGVAYSYANKIFNLGPAASSGAGSLYYGLGLDYSITRTADLVLQWARARGNNSTGSSDLYSLGVVFAIV